VTAFLDTAVFMYAGGSEHPHRDSCRAILRQVDEGTLDATTSVEVVQEILHRFLAIRRPEVGAAMAGQVMDAFAPVLPVTHGVMRRVPRLVVAYPRLSARDLIHVATCIGEGIDTIVSPDRGFDQVREVRRLDPAEMAAG
jgi:predicted nucleic acid-binding protein